MAHSSASTLRPNALTKRVAMWRSAGRGKTGLRIVWQMNARDFLLSVEETGRNALWR